MTTRCGYSGASLNLRFCVSSLKKQESSRETSTSALLTTSMPLTVWITTNWKILKEMRIPDHLTFLLRNLYAGQEATVTTDATTHLLEWPKSGTPWHQILARMWNNKNYHTLLLGMQNDAATIADSLVVYYRTKHILV